MEAAIVAATPPNQKGYGSFLSGAGEGVTLLEAVDIISSFVKMSLEV